MLAAAVAVAVIAMNFYGCQEKPSATLLADSETATGESWICTTVGDADFESWQPVEPIEGLTLHLQAQMVREREVFEKGFYQYNVRTNVGPILLKKNSGEVRLLSTGHVAFLPPGTGEWGMMGSVPFGEQRGGIEVSPSIAPVFKDADGAHHMFFLDVVDGNGCSLQTTMALCFANCALTQVTVPIIKPAQSPR